MIRCLLPTILLLISSTALAEEEYLIRVETVGYEDVPVSEKVPADKSLYSVEVIAVPNRRFRSRTRIGPETLTMEGTLKPQSDGNFSLQIRFCREVNTGTTVPAADGTQKAMFHKAAINTNLTIELDRSVASGGLESRTTKSVAGKKTAVKSKLQHVLIVTRRE